MAALALLVAVVALAAAAFGGWRLWQLAHSEHDAQARLGQLQQRLSQLHGTVTDLSEERAKLAKQLSAADDTNRGLRDQLSGLSERTRHLEDAVANLSAKQLSGHDGMLLDEAGMLLRLGQARFELFHDAGGALAAYRLADQTLASVNDPAVAGVRQSVADERAALAALNPEARQQQLSQVAAMRVQLASLPLKPLDDRNQAAPHGFWARVWHALSHLVRVDRDNGSPAGAADARMARELAALDLAQAQAARLAFDEDGWKAALKRVQDTLQTYFDTDNGDVSAMQAQIRQWLQSASAPAPQLGGALKQLHNLRAVNDAGQPASASSTQGGQR
ncbi:hypothetical protein HBF24_16725 [Oleiagrimonas sp. C23AA]|nr:hypothetical protein [Oleiagrimonas sp. C23AA]